MRKIPSSPLYARRKLRYDKEKRKIKRMGKSMLYAIANPAAGSGLGKKLGLALHQALEEKHIPHVVEETTFPGHATSLARQAAAQGADTVLSVGGDGTALEVARGLLGTSCALGLIPAGTGNDFRKTLGISKETDKALETVLKKPALPTDVGLINDDLFLNEIGTGFDVAVLDYAVKAKKYCRGLLPYLAGVICALFRFRPIPVTFRIDDGPEEKQDLFVIAAANGGIIGGGIVIAPDARADDGLLDIIIVDKIKWYQLPLRLVGLLQGKILSFPETRFVRAKKLSFSSPGMRLNVDGEIVSADTARVEILPGALKIHR